MEARSPGGTSFSSLPGRRPRGAPAQLRLADEGGALETRLKAARAALERAKVKAVVSYPFVGRQMRFESDTAVLQITNDGRFSYSTFPVGPTPHEVASGMRRHTPRLVVAIEGVLSNTAAAKNEGSINAAAQALAPKPEDASGIDPLTPRRAAGIVPAGTPGAGGAPGTGGPTPEAAHTVEGVGCLRHECEECQGQSKLLRVEYGEWRFAISVSPFYGPTMAVVQNVSAAGATERPQVLTSVPVQSGEGFTEDPHKASPPKLQLLPPHSMAARRSRGQLLRFSHSDLSFAVQSENGASSPAGHGGGTPFRASNAATAKRMLLSSVSVPQLMEGHKDSTGWSLDQWRDHFRAGAADLKAGQGRRPRS